MSTHDDDDARFAREDAEPVDDEVYDDEEPVDDQVYDDEEPVDDEVYDDEEDDCYQEDPFAQVLLTADGENIPDVLKGIQLSIEALTDVLEKQSRVLYKFLTRLAAE